MMNDSDALTTLVRQRQWDLINEAVEWRQVVRARRRRHP
jgi:hypothetical protein